MPRVSMEFELADGSVTETLGRALARAYPAAAGGAVVYLQGDLGAGKTDVRAQFAADIGSHGAGAQPDLHLGRDV